MALALGILSNGIENAGMVGAQVDETMCYSSLDNEDKS